MPSATSFSSLKSFPLFGSLLFVLLSASVHLSSAVPTGAVLGIDLGSDNCVVAIARRKGVDIVANEASQRSTPSVVSVSYIPKLWMTQGTIPAHDLEIHRHILPNSICPITDTKSGLAFLCFLLILFFFLTCAVRSHAALPWRGRRDEPRHQHEKHCGNYLRTPLISSAFHQKGPCHAKSCLEHT
jgi:hypothetical protein